MLFRALQTKIGARSRNVMIDNISIRVIRPIREPEKIYTFASLDMSWYGCCDIISYSGRISKKEQIQTSRNPL